MMASEGIIPPPHFQPPRKRTPEGTASHKNDSGKKKTKVRSKFGQSSKGIDVIVVRDNEFSQSESGTSPGTPISPISQEHIRLGKLTPDECRSDVGGQSDAISETVSASSNENYLTMSGTIRRGKKSVESIDVKLQLSREELDKLEASIVAKSSPDNDDCFFGISKGLHVFILSLFCLPFVIIVSSGYSFYFGTVTWYNIVIYFNEEKSLLHKVLLPPFLILFYPFYIIFATVGLGLYSAAVQVSWYYDSWKIEIQDLEKGFYGWLCLQMGLVSCAPYEVVIIEKNDVENLQECKKTESTIDMKISDTAL